MKKSFKTADLKLELKKVNAQIETLMEKQERQNQERWWLSMVLHLIRILLMLLCL